MSLAEYGEPEELRFPVPHGIIAAKAWGPKDGIPVLGIHGWQDNAASFDLLVQHLPNSLYFVAYDQICHGKSTKLPSGIPLCTTLNLLDVRYVLEALGWKRYSIISHSAGSIYAFITASSYPNEVDYLISLDFFRPFYEGVHKPLKDGLISFMEVTRSQMEGKEVSLTRSDALKIYSSKARMGIPKEGASALLKRSSYKQPNGRYVLTDDHRAKNSMRATMNTISPEMQNSMFIGLKAKFLLIAGSMSFMTKVEAEKQNETREILRKGCKSFSEIQVPSFHFPHVQCAKAVGEIITKFMNL